MSAAIYPILTHPMSRSCDVHAGGLLSGEAPPGMGAHLKGAGCFASSPQVGSLVGPGHGECWLRLPEVAKQVEETLLAEDGKTCRFQAWVIMPNHTHLVVDVWQTPFIQAAKQLEGTQFLPGQPGDWSARGILATGKFRHFHSGFSPFEPSHSLHGM